MSLLSDAKGYKGQQQKRQHALTDEVVDLALAWLKSEIKYIAVRQVLTKRNSVYTQSYPTLARALRKAYEQERLIIRDRRK